MQMLPLARTSFGQLRVAFEKARGVEDFNANVKTAGGTLLSRSIKPVRRCDRGPSDSNRASREADFGADLVYGSSGEQVTHRLAIQNQ